MIDDLLLRAGVFGAVLGALGTVAMAMYLLAVRFVDWDMVPRSALRRVHWWQRHAHVVLLASLVVTAGALASIALRALA